MSAPVAEVLSVVGNRARVACPFCAGEHLHLSVEPGTDEWRVPGCSMFLSPEVRAAGYRFHVPERPGTPARRECIQ